MTDKLDIQFDFAIETAKADTPKSIPIIINNYNTLSYLHKMVDYLEATGHSNIYVIDNNSDYKPLLSYYDNSSLRVFRCNQNIGYLALWETFIIDLFINDYYIYTDSDILPDKDCPTDFVAHFKKFLLKFPQIDKVGFSLRIDDLPQSYRLRDKVIKHESQFWKHKYCEGLYNAPIDTTFALYRPHSKGPAATTIGGRTEKPYTAHHLPWYTDHSNLTSEQKYYYKSKKVSTHWSDHPDNFHFFKRLYMLIQRDQLPLIWNARKYAKKILIFLGIMKP